MEAHQEILNIENLNYSYNANDTFTLQNINLKFETNKLYAILGPNGSGKSTLINCMCNYIKDYKGQISINKNNTLCNLKDLKQNDIAKNISIVPQQSISSTLSVYDNVMLGRKPYISLSPMMADHEVVSQMIDLFNLNSLCLKPCTELSGGELQTVNIARAFAQKAKIILMDEPTNNLDIKKQLEIFSLIKKRVQKDNLCSICVLHDINHAIKYADCVIILKNGKIEFFDTPEKITEDVINKIYDIKSKIILNDNKKYLVI